jgi:hypothetical protein
VALALLLLHTWTSAWPPRLGLGGRSLMLALLAWLGLGLWSWGRRRTLRFLAATALANALFLAAELGLRQLPGDHLPATEFLLYTYDPQLGWRYRAGMEGVVASPGEFRRPVTIGPGGWPTAPLAPPADVQPPRLVVLGDSFTANLSVPPERRFTALLGAGLGARVLNRGIPGHGQAQQRLLLEEVLRGDAPDAVVVVVFVRNDPDDNVGRLDALYEVHRPWARLDPAGAVQIDGVPVAKGIPTLDHVSAVFELGSCSVRLALGRGDAVDAAFRAGPPPELRYGSTPLGAPEVEALSVTVALLEQMSARCEEVGVRFGVILAPTLWQVDDAAWRGLAGRLGVYDLDREAPQAFLAGELRQRGVPCLDLLPPLRAARRTGDPLYHPWDTHWTVAGNRAVADAVAPWLRSQGLLARRE